MQLFVMHLSCNWSVRGLSKYLEIFWLNTFPLAPLNTYSYPLRGPIHLSTMSKSTSLAASASADPGIEPDVPTAAEIVIDSNMVNFHGEATDENTFLPRAVMIQVAASLSNFGTKDDLVYGGILPLQVTNANIVAGHQEEVCKLLVPFTDVTATNKDWHIISTLKSACYSYFKVTHPKKMMMKHQWVRWNIVTLRSLVLPVIIL